MTFSILEYLHVFKISLLPPLFVAIVHLAPCVLYLVDWHQNWKKLVNFPQSTIMLSYHGSWFKWFDIWLSLRRSWVRALCMEHNFARRPLSLSGSTWLDQISRGLVGFWIPGFRQKKNNNFTFKKHQIALYRKIGIELKSFFSRNDYWVKKTSHRWMGQHRKVEIVKKKKKQKQNLIQSLRLVPSQLIDANWPIFWQSRCQSTKIKTLSVRWQINTNTRGKKVILPI